MRDTKKLLSDCENSIMNIIFKRGNIDKSKIMNLLSGNYSVDTMLQSFEKLKERGLIEK